MGPTQDDDPPVHPKSTTPRTPVSGNPPPSDTRRTSPVHPPSLGGGLDARDKGKSRPPNDVPPTALGLRSVRPSDLMRAILNGPRIVVLGCCSWCSVSSRAADPEAASRDGARNSGLHIRLGLHQRRSGPQWSRGGHWADQCGPEPWGRHQNDASAMGPATVVRPAATRGPRSHRGTNCPQRGTGRTPRAGSSRSPESWPGPHGAPPPGRAGVDLGGAALARAESQMQLITEWLVARAEESGDKSGTLT